jgi:hypothetical protein
MPDLAPATFARWLGLFIGQRAPSTVFYETNRPRKPYTLGAQWGPRANPAGGLLVHRPRWRSQLSHRGHLTPSDFPEERHPSPAGVANTACWHAVCNEDSAAAFSVSSAADLPLQLGRLNLGGFSALHTASLAPSKGRSAPARSW